MKVSYYIYCNCFAKGKFDYSTAPFNNHLIKDEDGCFVYDYNKLVNKNDAIDQIELWQDNLCSHDYPVDVYSSFTPDVVHLSDYAGMMDEVGLPLLALIFSTQFQCDLNYVQVQKTLAEITRLKSSSFDAIRLVESSGQSPKQIAITSFYGHEFVASLFCGYSSYLDHSGFNIIAEGAAEIAGNLLESNSPDKAFETEKLLFSAKRFKLKQISDNMYRYSDLESNKSVEVPIYISDKASYQTIQEGIFEVEYLFNFKLGKGVSTLIEDIEDICKQAVEHDGWIEILASY